MGQGEILHILEGHKDVALSIMDIASELLGKENIKSIQKGIAQLEKYGEIKSIRVDVKVARRIYGKNLKKGVRVYWVDD